MLRQQALSSQAVTPPLTPPVEALPGDAAEARVSPAEFAQAVAALEAQRAREAALSGETIRVGEAITQLNLDATPDEILAHVEAVRKTNAILLENKALEQHERSTWLTYLRVGIYFSVFFLTSLVAYLGWSATQKGITPVSATTAAISSPRANVPVRDGDTVRLLSEVGDNQVVEVKAQYLPRLLTTQEQYIDTSNFSDSGVWKIVKQKGVIYLLAWLGSPMSDAALRQGLVTLYRATPTSLDSMINLGPSSDRFPNPQPILLRADRIKAGDIFNWELDNARVEPEPGAMEAAQALLKTQK